MYRKHLSEPWLGYILKGEKVYEGRLKRDLWVDLVKDDILIFYNESKEVKVKIIDILEYRNFGEVWLKCREQLLPGIETVSEAVALYHKIYKEEDILKYGVRIFKLEIITF